MILQNFENVAEEKKEQEQKKGRQSHRGSRRGTGCPNYSQDNNENPDSLGQEAWTRQNLSNSVWISEGKDKTVGVSEILSQD